MKWWLACLVLLAIIHTTVGQEGRTICAVLGEEGDRSGKICLVYPSTDRYYSLCDTDRDDNTVTLKFCGVLRRRISGGLLDVKLNVMTTGTAIAAKSTANVTITNPTTNAEKKIVDYEVGEDLSISLEVPLEFVDENGEFWITVKSSGLMQGLGGGISLEAPQQVVEGVIDILTSSPAIEKSIIEVEGKISEVSRRIADGYKIDAQTSELRRTSLLLSPKKDAEIGKEEILVKEYLGLEGVPEVTDTLILEPYQAPTGTYLHVETLADVDWVIINFAYFESELSALTINEDSLFFIGFDNEAQGWVRLDEDSDWVNSWEVDTRYNRIKANVSHLSVFGIAGSVYGISGSVYGISGAMAKEPTFGEPLVIEPVVIKAEEEETEAPTSSFIQYLPIVIGTLLLLNMLRKWIRLPKKLLRLKSKD